MWDRVGFRFFLARVGDGLPCRQDGLRNMYGCIKASRVLYTFQAVSANVVGEKKMLHFDVTMRLE